MLLNNRVRKLDFQDLVVFQQIHELKSVAQVAEQLSVSQSTVSYCLKRLRECFDDELFTHTSFGMSPSPRAEALAPRIRIMLNQMLECTREDLAFDPGSHPSAFTICAPEYFEIVVMPELMKNILEARLPVSIHIQKPDKDLPYSEILKGDIDLAVFFGPGHYEARPSLRTQNLFSDCLLGVFDGEDDKAPLTPEDMRQRKHVYPTPWVSDTNMVDGWMLRQLGAQRTIAARANSYYAAVNMLAGTDLLLMLPRRVHERLQRQQPTLGSRPAPEGLPDFTLDMIWSAARSDDPANAWLRKELLKACAGV